MIVVLETVVTVFFCTIFYFSSEVNLAVTSEVTVLKFVAVNLAIVMIDC